MSSMKFAFEGESSEDEKEDCNKLKVNESFAKNYDTWRRKEEYQKLKDKYGDIDNESEESSSDNELAGTECPEFDMDFFRVVAALELKHPILKEDRKFFKDNYQFKTEAAIGKEEKPLTLKDYERKIILEKGGVYDDEDDQMPSTSYHISDKSDIARDGIITKKGCGFDDDNVSDDEDEEKNKISVAGLFTKKEKTAAEVAADDRISNDAISYLKGKKKTLDSKIDEELLSGLKKAWMGKMSNEDKFLMDYFVNERYLEEEDDTISRSPNRFAFDPESMSDDEKTYNTMEEFESKYRFRFEELDEEFIKSHPRVIEDSIRSKADKRKEIRNRRQVRQEEAEERRIQEINRMKAYKRKEIMERIENLKKIAGNDDMNFEEMDLDADFDPEKHDKVMSQMFDDDYYHDGQDERDKPSIEDEELKRELEEEYAKLENLDSMTQGSYRYEKVEPNSFGLTTDEILMAKDTELNRWYSLKKMLRHERSRELELRELKNYCHRASKPDVKKKILPSLFTDNVEDVWAAEEERKRIRNLKKKLRRLRKKEIEENVSIKEQLIETIATEEAEMKSKKKSKKKEKLKGETIENADITNETNGLGDDAEIKQERKKKKKEKEKTTNEAKDIEMECDGNVEICKKKKKRKRCEREVIIDQDVNGEMKNDDDGSSNKTKKCKKVKLDKISENIVNEEDKFKSPEKKGSKKKHKLKVEETYENNTLSLPEQSITMETQTPNANTESLNSTKWKKDKSLISEKFNQKDVTFNNKFNLSNKNQLTQSNKLRKKKNKLTDSRKQLPIINEKESELKGITNARLAAYGANPKKLRKKLKYSNK